MRGDTGEHARAGPARHEAATMRARAKGHRQAAGWEQASAPGRGTGRERSDTQAQSRETAPMMSDEVSAKVVEVDADDGDGIGRGSGDKVDGWSGWVICCDINGWIGWMGW